jgi:hypothetical protein
VLSVEVAFLHRHAQRLGADAEPDRERAARE